MMHRCHLCLKPIGYGPYSICVECKETYNLHGPRSTWPRWVVDIVRMGDREFRHVPRTIKTVSLDAIEDRLGEEENAPYATRYYQAVIEHRPSMLTPSRHYMGGNYGHRKTEGLWFGVADGKAAVTYHNGLIRRNITRRLKQAPEVIGVLPVRKAEARLYLRSLETALEQEGFEVVRHTGRKV